MEYRNFILSPCGTSLLTNGLEPEKRGIVFRNSNKKNRTDIPENEQRILQECIDQVASRLDTVAPEDAIRMSAELNGIIRFYEGDITSQGPDFHFLLSTDTWLGHQTAMLVARWLCSANPNFTVDVHRHTDLQTGDLQAFQLSLSELVRKFNDELVSYRESGYRVIFNLTGGFKSIQGFLQTIASFYADESIYIFETSSELLRIPRLPIRMDFVDTFARHITPCRQLHIGLPVLAEKAASIPETLLMQVDDEVAFSPWGELVFSRIRREIYSKKLLPPPVESRVRYSRGFIKDVERLPPDRIALVNERIDQLTRHIINPAYNPRSLDFKKLKGNPKPPATHEVDAWSDRDARRIFGYFNQDVFVLDSLDKGLH